MGPTGLSLCESPIKAPERYPGDSGNGSGGRSVTLLNAFEPKTASHDKDSNYFRVRGSVAPSSKT